MFIHYFSAFESYVVLRLEAQDLNKKNGKR